MKLRTIASLGMKGIFSVGLLVLGAADAHAWFGKKKKAGG